MNLHAKMQMSLNIELLIKLMKMTTSATDGEALAAIRMANKQLAQIGGDWEELLRGKLAPIDPFASLPEPPKAAPKAAAPQPMAQNPYAGQASQTWQNKPTPPPPPRFYGLDPKEAKDITTWLVTCEFASLDPHLTRQINHIMLRWRANKSLDSADYTTLKNTAAAHGKRKRRP